MQSCGWWDFYDGLSQSWSGIRRKVSLLVFLSLICCQRDNLQGGEWDRSENDTRGKHAETGRERVREGDRERRREGEGERERGREGEELRADACLNNFSWTLFQTPTTATHPLCPSPSAPAPAGRSSCERPRALMRYLTNESTKIITSTPSQVIQLVIERTHENFY